ncbi:uncharacterized protein BDV17DRAFT_287682 [Aspergillus undulatus]|uniref:uncharacterized protein n=1 Tax=Aspergillus undulatus TaxID=1810928 RepID=UPI003CCCEE71
MQVHCVPNTQLQLLDLRGPGIFLEHYALEKCLPQTEHDSDDWDDIETPKSPLFGFSPLGGDATHDFVPSPGDSSVFDDNPIPQFWPVPEQNEDFTAADQNTKHEATFHDAESSRGSPLSSESTARPLSCSPELYLEVMAKSRKRSATEADFPDSGSDADNELTGVLKEVANRKVRQLKPIGSTSTGDRETGGTLSESIYHREIAHPRSPKKLSPIKKSGPVVSHNVQKPERSDRSAGSPEEPRTATTLGSDNIRKSAILKSPDKAAGSPVKSGSTRTPGLVVHNDNSTLKSPNSFTGSPKKSGSPATPSLAAPNANASSKSPERLAGSPRKIGPATALVISKENVSPRGPGASATSVRTLEKPKKTDQSVFKVNQPQASDTQSASISYFGTLESPARKKFADTAVGYHLAHREALGNKAVTDDSTSMKTIREPRVRFQIPNDTTAEAESSNGQSSSSIQDKMLGADPGPQDFELSPFSEDTDPYDAPENTREPSRLYEHIKIEQPESSDQPEVKTINGLVILENSERVLSATFKVTITASVFLRHPNEKGWADLEVPGIPRMGGGKTGFLLFLMPENRGLEIRTTTVTRATIVENCLFAEFINRGNLVVPVRQCDKKCCGVISGFTVDQEILSHNIAKPAATEDRRDQPIIQMRCHALCSLRLHNRCFWTDKCIIYLYVDGGPHGYFKCDVTSQQDAMKKIYITAKEGARMGVSRLRITCSPKDLDRLYVRWTLKFPGIRAAYWAPRIYSGLSKSHEESKHHQRYDLLEVLNDPSYLFSGTEATEVECIRDSGFNSTYEHIELPSENAEGNPNSISSQPALTWPIGSQIEQAVHLQASYCNWYLRYVWKRILMGVLCLAFLRIGVVMFAKSKPAMTQGPLQVVEQISSTALPHFSDKMSNSQDRLDQESCTGDRSILDRYRAIDTERKTKPLKRSEGEQRQSINVEENGEQANSPLSIRDRIDYWLGWPGPVDGMRHGR